MAQEEVFGTRDRTYSAWHRRMSIRRYVGIEKAQILSMIDLDASLYVEYDDHTKEPLALIETAMDHGQDFKNGTVTRNLARRTGFLGECGCCGTRIEARPLPAFVLLYTVSNEQNPADNAAQDIALFRYQRLWPRPSRKWVRVSPQMWAELLVKLREWSASGLDRWLDSIEGEP